jgi:phenylacetic acid degradation operon negative regulatory protein
MTRKLKSPVRPAVAAPALAQALDDPLAPAKGPLHGGSSTQDLLVTLLGDYWFGQDCFIPSAALVELLSAFDVSTQAARAALSRALRAGVLVGQRDSRRTAYRMSDRGVRGSLRAGRAIMRFSQQRAATVRVWDGTWTLVTYSLATEQAEARRRIRRHLRSRGFAPLQDAVWVSPHRRRDEIASLLSAFDVASFAIFEDAQLVTGSVTDPAELWPLDAIATHYRALNAAFKRTITRMRRRQPAPKAALVLRTHTMNAWRTMPVTDPNLPPEMLPADWPGWEARQRFTEIYDGLAAPAARFVRQVVASHSAEAAAAVQFDTVTNPRGGEPQPRGN